jgi:antibiotic biosynthesis monooxygenase (ABM) superfamily enzyme
VSEWPSHDPVLRWLRALAVLAVLMLVVLVVGVGVIADRPIDLPLVALLCGVVLLQLGYEVIVPGLSGKPKDDDHD